jgi:hypothetical protein
MVFFGKLKSTPNLHQQNPVPWNDLEKCLKIEHLMEDMHQEYLDHTSTFDTPLPSHFTKYLPNSNPINKPVCPPLEPIPNNPLSLMLIPPSLLKALSSNNALCFPIYESPKSHY